MAKPTTFEEAIAEVTGELRELMINKQRDYGHSNITDFGEYGVLVRLNDKVCRLKNLLGNKKQETKTGNRITKTGLYPYARQGSKYKGGVLALTPPKEKGVTDNVSFQEASVRLTTILILIITYIIVGM